MPRTRQLLHDGRKRRALLVLSGAILLLVLVNACLLLPGGKAVVTCYADFKGGFCGLRTARDFYIADNLPTGLQCPGVAVLFLGIPAGCQSIHMHGEEIHILIIVRLPDSR